MSALRLLLVSDAVGGVWVYSLELARELQKFGIETILALAGPSPTLKQRSAAEGIRLIDTGLPLEWLDTTSDEVERASKELAQIAARENADLIQTSSAALLARVPSGRPCIAVQHSCVATWWAAVMPEPLAQEFEWRRNLVEEGLLRADAIIAPTHAFASATKQAYRLNRPVLTVYNGRTRQNSRSLPQGHFVFTAGRLWDQGKNVATLDRAAGRLNIPFQAAGPSLGPNGAGVSIANLTLLGDLGATRMSGILRARPIYASAALYEPFGLSVLEAAQSGCALLLSDIPTHRELWEGAAIFLDPRDDAAYADAVDNLLNDALERERLGQRALERSCQYSVERTALEMAQIYGAVTQQQGQLMAGAAA